MENQDKSAELLREQLKSSEDKVQKYLELLKMKNHHHHHPIHPNPINLQLDDEQRSNNNNNDGSVDFVSPRLNSPANSVEGNPLLTVDNNPDIQQTLEWTQV